MSQLLCDRIIELDGLLTKQSKFDGLHLSVDNLGPFYA